MAFLSVIVFASCGAPADLTLAQDSEPQTLDPALMTGVAEGRIAAALFEGLTRLDPVSLEVTPGVAERWNVSPDGRTWHFHLRSDALWSNRKPVTSQDFQRSWLRVLNPETASSYAGLLFDVSGARAYQSGSGAADQVGIEAPDPQTLRVHLEHPVPYFPSLAAFFTLSPVPEDAIRIHGNRWTRPSNIVTNGPFHLAKWAFYREIILERSETYWNPTTVTVRRIRLIPVVDENTQFNLFATGSVDIAFSVPSQILDRLRGRQDFVNGPRLATAFLRLNVTRPPFDDPGVRRALSLAVDRDAIVSRITRGGERATGSLVPPVLPGYTPATGLSYDPDAARAELRGRSLPPILLLYPERPEYTAVAVVLQHQWREVLGLDVRLMPREWKVYLTSMKSLEYDIAMGQWIGDYPDPSTFLLCFRSDSGNNRTGWKNARYDKLLQDAAEQRVGESPAEHSRRRLLTFGQAERLLVTEEAPIVPIYHPAVRYMVSPRVTGFSPNVMGLVSFDALGTRKP